MQKRGLSQEGLKLIACVSMLLDHIGATVVMACAQSASGEIKGAVLELYEILRIIGRLAFPIYCFLLIEGNIHTRDPKRYALRLLIAAVLSEIPYDLALYGEITWQHQNVMITLLLGFCALEVMKKCPELSLKVLAAMPFAVIANLLRTDYGANGILVILLFAITRELRHKHLLQCLGLWFIFSPNHLMALNWIGGFSLAVQEWAVLSVVPISCYSGRKTTKSKVIQWAFYLFYPAHLLALYLIGRL